MRYVFSQNEILDNTIASFIKLNTIKQTFSKANPDFIEFRIISFPSSKVCADSAASFPRSITNQIDFYG